MSLNFPDSPVAGTVFGAWRYDGVKWGAVSGFSGGGGAGDITAVLAGAGLSGGGTEGDVSLTLAVPVTLSRGGTGATDAAGARASLGAAPLDQNVTLTGDVSGSGAQSSVITTTLAPVDLATKVTGILPLASGGTGVVTAAAAPWVESGGDTMSGLLTLSGPPSVALHAATKAYVDAGDTAALQAPAVQNNVGRNLIHNPLFNIAQRGIGSFTTSGYSLDRWYFAISGDTSTNAQSAANDTARAQIGDESITSYLACSVNGTAAAGAYTLVYQPIENVRRLAGKTIVVSFWAISTGTLKLGVSFDQAFGSGGSPSANVVINGQSITTSTTWTRYSLTFALPSTAGKTLGTSNNSSTNMFFWYSSGSTNNVRSGSIGVQSGVINIWGVQLEIGSTMTPLEKPDPRYDLANCQRFYQQTYLSAVAYQVSGQLFQQTAHYQPMRAAPTVTLFNDTSTGLGARSTSTGGAGAAVPVFVSVWGSASATGTVTLATGFNLSADL